MISKAAICRQHEGQCLLLAERTHDPTRKWELLALAHQWARLAKDVEKLETVEEHLNATRRAKWRGVTGRTFLLVPFFDHGIIE